MSPDMVPTFAPTETMPNAVRQWAERDPDRTFLVEVGGGTRSYGEFHHAALRWADAYSRLGVEPGENVASMARTSIATCEHWLGLGWLRGVQTGVNTDFRNESLAYVLENCRARHMVCESEFLERVAHVSGDLHHLETVVVPDADQADLPTDFPVRLLAADQLWEEATPATDLPVPLRHEISCITYTSGTTGPSKGILIPWGRHWPEAAWMDITEDDVCYDPFPFFHLSGVLALAWLAFPGGRVVLRESFKTSYFWDDIKTYGCTMTCLIPAMMNWLIDEPPRPDDLDNPLRVVAGAPIVPRLDDFKARFGIQMRTAYSSGETGMPLYAGPDVSADPATNAKWVADGFEARLADDDDYDVPPGESGELLVRAVMPWRMMAGYFGMPDKTAEAWRNGWFHTGDRAVLDDNGRFQFVDRMTDSMRRRGENISAVEVEAYVNAHPAVAESAAIGVPGEYGEDEVKVCVVVYADTPVTPAELHEYLVTRMPSFMVPRYIEFLDDPERTEAMKRIKKAPLRENALNDRTWDAARDRDDVRSRGARA